MEITKGIITGPRKVVIYGQEGVGKTTLASKFPNPIFIDIEGGTEHLDVARTPKPESWEMMLWQIMQLAGAPQGFQTCVVDTVDWAQRLAIRALCVKKGVDTLGDFDWGKGWMALRDMMGQFLDVLTDLRDKTQMHVVVLAHAAMLKKELPEEEGVYTGWCLKLDKGVQELVYEWPDALLFAAYKIYVQQDERTKKFKASGGERVLRTTHCAAWDAKNRLGLPVEIPLEFKQIATHFPPFAGATKKPAPAPAPATPAQPPQPAPEQAPAATQTPAPPPEPQDYPSEAHKTLAGLMRASGVNEAQVQAVIETHSDPRVSGVLPKGTSLRNYPEKFVSGFLLKFWSKIEAKIKEAA